MRQWGRCKLPNHQGKFTFGGPHDMDKLTRIEICQFKRTEGSGWELGLMLNDGMLGLIDESGKAVEGVWESTSTGFFDVEVGAIFESARTYFNLK